MSVNEIQALAQRFADALDKRDLRPVLEMLSNQRCGKIFRLGTVDRAATRSRRSLQN